MLALTREKRSNAGNKMASLLENEDDEDFYQSAYGGFSEETEDQDFDEEREEVLSEDSDSDISTDENDEPVSDHEEEETKKRKMRVVTKAYKEPERANKKAKIQVPKTTTSKPFVPNIEKKRMRESTTQKSLEVKQRAKAAAKLPEQSKKKSLENSGLTQEQLLEEAKVTEIKNLKSLEMFQKLELEKKKSKIVKQAYTGPMIKYHSVAMPMIEIVEDENGKEVSKTVGRCTRNFITYPDEATLKRLFDFEKPKPAPCYTSFISHTPAKYIDPLTKQPYSNVKEFTFLREVYYSQLEKKVDPKHPGAAKWLEWRKKKRALHNAR